MGEKYIQGTIRYDSRLQLRRLKQAAEKLHWSLNRLLLFGAQQVADRVLNRSDNPTTETTAEQLTVGAD